MSQSYYKANKSNSGAALNASFNSKDAKFYFKVTRQNGWNDQGRGNGIFKDGKYANVSFNLHEIEGVIDTIRARLGMTDSFHFYHTSDKGSTSGSIHYYNNPPKTQYNTTDKVKEGFGFTLKQGEETFKVGLSVYEALSLAAYLEFGREHCFSADYAEDKKYREEQAKKNNGGNEAPAPSANKPTRSTKSAAPKTVSVPAPAEPVPENEGLEEDSVGF